MEASIITREIESSSNDRDAVKQRRAYFFGYLLLTVAAVLYAIEESIGTGRLKENFSVFFIHYFLALAYTGVLLANGFLGIRKSWKRKNIHKTVILLNLFLISAYALNREVPVFEDSTLWLCCYLVLTSGVLLSMKFFEKLPKVVNRLQLFLLGSALVLYCYLAIFVADFYPVAGIGIILLGIGAHILVPAFFVIAIVALILDPRVRVVSRNWVVAGVTVTTLLIAAFIFEWDSRIKDMERTSNQSVLHADMELPVWVKIGQSLRNDWITERILKSNLVYTVANTSSQWDFFPTRGRWEEERMHDPLVFLASLYRQSSVSKDDCMNILVATSESRHKSEERLWSGNHLTTSYIITDADIYPDLRLAYTEKYFNIHNDVDPNRTWGAQEEALYTFQLPEGSVITSLSLWVNGKEEKAILSSRQKATEAYTTIVGKEMRDPSVVHWQEGNTVSVRVFPCTPSEERKFKIGITSPLPVQDNRVQYKGITFRGPNAGNATEVFRIRLMGNAADLNLPSSFRQNEKGEYVAEQNHDPDFNLSFAVVPIRNNQFTFNGYTYSLLQHQPVMLSRRFQSIYLDLNNTWTDKEVDHFRQYLTSYQIYAHAEGDFIPLNDHNWSDVTALLQERNFSIFPFHHIKDVETSLVVSKGRELSPHLRDFKESKFAYGVSEFFSSHRKVNLFNLESASTYIRSFKELRALNVADGSIEDLNVLLKTNQFPFNGESDDQIIIHDSDMMIRRKKATPNHSINTAPDHIARLFAYNNILRQVGAQFFNDDFINDSLIDEATTAYVVSPVSSLIVLETKEDYERFGITDKDNSLHNASKNSSGAVPEPHEWALIALFALSWLCMRNRFI